jgi:hypothetical protein
VSGIQYAPWYSPVFTLRWRLAFVFSALLIIFVIILSVFLYTVTSNQLSHNVQAAAEQRVLALRMQLVQDFCTPSSAQTLNEFIQQHLDDDTSSISWIKLAGWWPAATPDCSTGLFLIPIRLF